ncbi:MAG: class I SAM-dependent methyltransferase [Candidatus Omnitrophica bacterium]|nr:class I SAM-dependent methyltransferase [Candidatus Omnitrophota bacterium]
MAEINLMDCYPRSSRPIEERGMRKLARSGWLPKWEVDRTNEDILIEQKLLDVVRNFGKEYFDVDRLYGYGGYYYDPKFWTGTVKRFRQYYNLSPNASILDVGCAKGFLLHDFKVFWPQMSVSGIDISQYAYDHAIEDMKSFIAVGTAKALPYADKSFDLVVSINTVDHLSLSDCIDAIREIERVKKQNAFLTVNAWRNDEEKEKLLKWNITAKTVMHVDDWKKLFLEIGYTGDYWWFITD